MFRTCTMITTAILAMALPVSGAGQVTAVDRLAADQPPFVEATLGAEGHYVEGGYPEVSLAAIEHAISVGADMIRLPIHLTGDGHYVLMFGVSMNATTNVEEVFPNGASARLGKVSGARSDFIEDYTLAEIRQLRLTGGTDGGEHFVPTLDEALALINGQALARLNIRSFDSRETTFTTLEASS